MSKFTTSDEQTINYEHTPGEDVLVFIHGWMHNQTVWKKEKKHFQEQGHATISFDLRGHGKSSTPTNPEAYDMKRLVQDLQELLTHLKETNPTLIGHSLGGMIALSYLKEHPAKRLVLVDSTYENPAKHVPLIKNINWTPLTKQLIDYIKDKPAIKRRIGEVDYTQTNKNIPMWLIGAKHSTPHVILSCLQEILELDEEELLAQITIPTLILAGEKDMQTPTNISQKMHAQITNSQLVIIPGARHDSPRTHSKQIVEALEEFLQTHP